jgi:Flp pilus assembly protein TadD
MYLHVRAVVGLGGRHELPEAARAYAVAASIRPTAVGVLSNLASCLGQLGDADGELELLRESGRLLPADADLRRKLGIALIERKRYADARRELTEAVRLRPDSWEGHLELGRALWHLDDLDRAEAEAREAIRLGPKEGRTHNLLGTVFSARGRHEDAIAQFRKAVETEPEGPFDYLRNWATSLRWLGRYPEAVEVLKKHKAPAAAVRAAEAIAKSDRTLAALDRGEQPKLSGEDRAQVAGFAHDQKKRYVTAARLYSEAFTVAPALADPEAAGQDHLYDAACAAARAAAGDGPEGRSLPPADRTAWRKKSLLWLAASLRHQKEQATGRYVEQRADALRTLEFWEADKDLVGVRGDALKTLPADERKAWDQLWRDVRETAESLRQSLPPGGTPGMITGSE